MKKTLAVAGTVVALVVVPGMASAAEAVTVPASLVMQQSNCATDEDGGAKPVDEDKGEESNESGDDSGTGGAPGDNEEQTTTPATPSAEPSPEPSTSPTADPPTSPSEDAPAGTSGSTTPSSSSSGRSSFGLPRQQAVDDCSEALEPGSNYSDEDGDGEPEVKDQADDDGDGQVDEVDTASQVSVVPDGGAETGDGSTGGVIGTTSASAAVLALFAGFGLWVRRALARA